MTQLLQYRKQITGEMVKHLTELRNIHTLKKNPKARVVKQMDVVDDLIEKGFAHKSVQKEINEQI